jgi:DNA modification methylase
MQIEEQPLVWETQKRKVKELIPYEYNPRKLSEEKKEKLRRSLAKFNLAEIPAVNLDNTIIGGHQRVCLLLEAGRGEELIDVRVPNRQLTELEFKEYNLTSNINVGDWDYEMLDEFFNEVDFEGLGMDEADLLEISKLDLKNKEEEGVFDTELPINPISNPNDFFKIISVNKGLTHEIGCFDSTQLETTCFKDKKANLIITDPPYNVNYKGGTKDALSINNDNLSKEDFYDFLLKAFKNMFNIIEKGCGVYVFYSSTEVVNFRKAFQNAGFKFSQELVWVKNHFVLSRNDYHNQHEPCLYGEVDKENLTFDKIGYGWIEGMKHKWYSDRKQSTVLLFDKPLVNQEHPTIKPLELFEYLINNSSKKNDTVLDVFAGSGTTLIASEKLNRNSIVCENDPKYVDVIIRRYITYMNNNDLPFKIFKNNIELGVEERNKYLA